MRSSYSVSNIRSIDTSAVSSLHESDTGYFQVLDESMCVLREDLNEWLQCYLFSAENIRPIQAHFLLDRLTSGLWLARLACKLQLSVLESNCKKLPEHIFIDDNVLNPKPSILSLQNLPTLPQGLVDSAKCPLGNDEISTFESKENTAESDLGNGYNSFLAHPNSCLKIGRLVGHWVARDTISSFIKWCKDLGVPQTILFETSGLITRREEKNVILTLLSLARIAARYGLNNLPYFIKMEREIDSLERMRNTNLNQHFNGLNESMDNTDLFPQNSDELSHNYASQSIGFNCAVNSQTDSDFEFEFNDDLRYGSIGSATEDKLSVDKKSSIANSSESHRILTGSDHSSFDEQDISTADSGCLLQATNPIVLDVGSDLKRQSFDPNLASVGQTHAEKNSISNNTFGQTFIDGRTENNDSSLLLKNNSTVVESDKPIQDHIDNETIITTVSQKSENSPKSRRRNSSISPGLDITVENYPDDQVTVGENFQVCEESSPTRNQNHASHMESQMNTHAHDESRDTGHLKLQPNESLTCSASPDACKSINPSRADRVNQSKSSRLPIRSASDAYIHREVKEKVAQCTCCSRLHMQRLEEGRYKLKGRIYYIRRFRNHVMVRVGGGWLTIDEFFVSHDPCRSQHAPALNRNHQEQSISQDSVPSLSSAHSSLMRLVDDSSGNDIIRSETPNIKSSIEELSFRRPSSSESSPSKFTKQKCPSLLKTRQITGRSAATSKSTISKNNPQLLNVSRGSRGRSNSVSHLSKPSWRI